MTVFNKNELPDDVRNNLPKSQTATELHQWAGRLRALSIKLAITIIVIGLFSAIGDALSIDSDESGIVLAVVIFSMFDWILYAIIEYFACHAIALLLSAVSEIVQNTFDSRNMAVLTAAKNFSNEKSEARPAQRNEENFASMQSANKPASKNEARPTPWICPKCGAWNSSKDEVCFKCKIPRK